MGNFAVIDTETNWENRVMSIGTVIAQEDSFRAVAARYHILTPEYLVGGMYADVLVPDRRLRPLFCPREEAMADLVCWLEGHQVTAVFAYNANFDHKLMPELDRFDWYDIMRLAAYKQYNRKIPATADCCSTGRLRRSYGVEPMLRLLSGDFSYRETHNAMYDAMDELAIMRLLEHPLSSYIKL